MMVRSAPSTAVWKKKPLLNLGQPEICYFRQASEKQMEDFGDSSHFSVQATGFKSVFLSSLENEFHHKS